MKSIPMFLCSILIAGCTDDEIKSFGEGIGSVMTKNNQANQYAFSRTKTNDSSVSVDSKPMNSSNQDQVNVPLSNDHTIEHGKFTGLNYDGSAKIFSCMNGVNIESGNKEGISTLCINGAGFFEATDTRRLYSGSHKIFSCPDGSYNLQSGNKEGIFSVCYKNNKEIFMGIDTGRTYSGNYPIISCPDGLKNMESGNKEGIAESCIDI